MNTTVINATEYRDVPLAALIESATNPRRHFDEAFLNGLAESIRANGVLSPLLVRPKNERLEIVFGAQRAPTRATGTGIRRVFQGRLDEWGAQTEAYSAACPSSPAVD